MSQNNPNPNRLQDNLVFDLEAIRSEFPILKQQVNGHRLVYLDNGATSQKPQCVIDCLIEYYEHYNANVHRGVHTLSEKATNRYEGTRGIVQRFINAGDEKEVIFTKGTTDGINLVAQSYARPLLQPGDEILISEMEHHSNIVPWQLVCEQTGATLKVVPMDDNGELIMERFHELLSERTKLVAVVYVSNSLGTINPVEEIITAAHALGVPVLLDAAQAVPHMKVDVQALDCDFLAFSAHKVFGPTGIGVLYGKRKLLEDMPPYQGGGDMILTVSFEKTTYNDLPYKFEAGTPNIADAIGMGVGLEWLDAVGQGRVSEHEHRMLRYGTQRLNDIDGVTIIGNAVNKASILSFVIDGVHPHDIGTLLDGYGIAVRTGHHCTQPVMEHFQVPATVRASLALYNGEDDLDLLAEGVEKVKAFFR